MRCHEPCIATHCPLFSKRLIACRHLCNCVDNVSAKANAMHTCVSETPGALRLGLGIAKATRPACDLGGNIQTNGKDFQSTLVQAASKLRWMRSIVGSICRTTTCRLAETLSHPDVMPISSPEQPQHEHINRLSTRSASERWKQRGTQRRITTSGNI